MNYQGFLGAIRKLFLTRFEMPSDLDLNHVASFYSRIDTPSYHLIILAHPRRYSSTFSCVIRAVCGCDPLAIITYHEGSLSRRSYCHHLVPYGYATLPYLTSINIYLQRQNPTLFCPFFSSMLFQISDVFCIPQTLSWFFTFSSFFSLNFFFNLNILL